MKNKISNLRDHMFAALERLGEEGLTEEQLRTEIARSQAISEIGKVIVDSAKTEVLFAKVTGGRDKNFKQTGFLNSADIEEFGEQNRPNEHTPEGLKETSDYIKQNKRGLLSGKK